MADLVEIILALKNVREFVSGAGQAAGAMEKVGDTSEKAGKQAGISWKGVAKWAGGAAAIYGATKFATGAVTATESLAKSTVALQRQTNLDTKTASEWVGVLKERGIATSTFQVGLKTLSKAMEKARTGGVTAATTIKGLRQQIDDVSKAGGKKAPAELDKLSKAIARAQTTGEKSQSVFTKFGISLDAVRRGDTKTVLYQMADALQRIKNPAERSTLAQTLLGKSGITLLPILMKGRKAIEEQLGVQEKYGNYLSGKGAKNAATLIQQQRELHAAFEGVKVQLGQSLLPVLVSLAKVILRIVNVVQPLTRNATALKIALVALTAAFVVYKVAMIAAAVAQNVFNVSLGMTAFWIGIGVVAFAALVIGLILLYKHCKVFREAVNALWRAVKFAAGAILAAFKFVWNWVKTNWPLLAAILVGPIAILAYEAYKHFDALKHYASVAFNFVKSIALTVFNWIKQNWPLLLGILTGPFGLAVAVIVTHFDTIKTTAINVGKTLAQPFVNAFNTIKSTATSIVTAIEKAFDGLVAYVQGIPGKIGGIAKHIPGYGLAKKALGFLAEGGIVGAHGQYVVGERGPEIVTLPRGTAVQPITAGKLDTPITFGGGRPLEIIVPVQINEREIARATARVTADRLARR